MAFSRAPFWKSVFVRRCSSLSLAQIPSSMPRSGIREIMDLAWEEEVILLLNEKLLRQCSRMGVAFSTLRSLRVNGSCTCVGRPT